jgi:hypothetical protein
LRKPVAIHYNKDRRVMRPGGRPVGNSVKVYRIPGRICLTLDLSKTIVKLSVYNIAKIM